MTGSLPEVIEIHKTIPARVGENIIGGDSYVDDGGNWVLQLDIYDADGGRLIGLREGDTFRFAGVSWTATKVFEPTTATRGAVATLTRVQ